MQHQQTADVLPESEAHCAGDIGSCIDITERKQMEEALREVGIHNTGYGAGWPIHTHLSGEAFLRAYDPGQAGCVVLDLCMPHVNGCGRASAQPSADLTPDQERESYYSE